ncbi:MAG: T9SS type A sorting domain-containing protein [Crocinitomix sp.]|nr:T9SS type A sorting domain-containing protein [Crocinitomix sp.]
MKNYIIIVLFSICFQIPLNAQIVNYGQPSTSLIGSNGIIDQDGNHVFLSRGNTNNILSFFGPDNVEIWSKKFDFSSTDGIILELSDGDYLCALSSSFGQILKFNSAGDIIWHKKIHFQIKSAFECVDNRIVIAGQRIDSFLMMIDLEGNTVWSRKIEKESPYSVVFPVAIPSIDNEILFTSKPRKTGDSISYQNFSKFNIDGDLVWQKSLIKPFNHYANSMVQAESGAIYTVGSAIMYGEPNFSDVLISKYSSTGEFERTIQCGYQWGDDGFDIIEDINGDILIVGFTKPVEVCGGNLLVMKFNPDLDVIFTKIYGTPSGSGAFYFHLHQKDEMIYAYGSGSLWTSISEGGGSDVHLLKTDSEFEFLCNQYDQDWELEDVAYLPSDLSVDIVTHVGANNPVESTVEETTLNYDWHCGVSLSSTDENKDGVFKLFPNPTSGNFRISGSTPYKIIVSDISGKTVYESDGMMTSPTAEIDLSQQNKGIYFVNILGEDQNEVIKIILN